MRLSLLTLFCCGLGLATQLHAQSPPAPQVMGVGGYDAASKVLSLNFTVMLTREVLQRQTAPDGKLIAVPVTVFEESLRRQDLNLADLKFSNVAGKDLNAADAAKKLKPGQAVVVLTMGANLSKLQRSLYRDDAIIIEVKPMTPTPAQGPPPAP
ncbi:hypothetical protein [Anatilimnocola floriformis]|uniref:hypothetical protein n=1 Tax=Anatilimnocola floriformis TaxID=2948575 RepID=UPI0020C49453|nr:hypothetical protein [Anatilimnocola floriformis]